MTPSISNDVLLKVAIFTLLYLATGGIIATTAWITPNGMESNQYLRAAILFFAGVLLSKYVFYMLLSPWHDACVAISRFYWRLERPEYHPLVSVLVPAWNEEVGILNTISSLVENSYDKVEIVVVNDGSTDNSDALVREYKAAFDSRPPSEQRGKTITYHYQPNGGKGTALNTAISLATGDILISIDADCFVALHSIRNFVECFRNPRVMAAVGNVKIGNTKQLIGLIQYMEFLFSFYFKKADSIMNTIYIIGGAAGAFRREIFNMLGGYSTKNITEDIDLSIRIQDAGLRILYACDAVVYTEGASELSGLMKQRLRWKRGRFETFRDYAHMFFSIRRRHNKMLTLILLPLAMFSELQLLLEFFFLAFLYVFSFISGDFSSFISGILVVSSMFMVQMLFDDKDIKHFSFYTLAPIAWLLFYLMSFVETSALVRSIWGFLTNTEVTWQRWQRKGLNG